MIKASKKIKFIILLLVFNISFNSYPFDMNIYYWDQEYKYLKGKYKWFLDDIYYNVKKYCNISPRIVFSLIQVESSGRTYAKGKKVLVSLIRNGKYVYEYHYAVGLMQVMTFHYENKNYKNYFNLEKNIQLGCKVLNECFIFNNYDFVRSISCYNMGINSKKINYRYVKKVIREL